MYATKSIYVEPICTKVLDLGLSSDDVLMKAMTSRWSLDVRFI